jgi:LDH2 family malate/lactate/ureidoglycolate dehydrogenase
MALPGTRRRFFGANPWAFAVPTDDGQPVIVDASTAAIAEGKVRVARASGASLPPDAIVDASGRSTIDPEDFYAGGALLPLGGAVAGHKGYGLALASALLGGLAMINDSDPSLIGASVQPALVDEPGHVGGFLVIAIDPAAFGDSGSYIRLAGDVVRAIRTSPPVDPDRPPVVPGDPEANSRKSREHAITLPRSLHRDLTSLAKRFAVPVPAQW